MCFQRYAALLPPNRSNWWLLTEMLLISTTLPLLIYVAVCLKQLGLMQSQQSMKCAKMLMKTYSWERTSLTQSPGCLRSWIKLRFSPRMNQQGGEILTGRMRYRLQVQHTPKLVACSKPKLWTGLPAQDPISTLRVRLGESMRVMHVHGDKPPCLSDHSDRDLTVSQDFSHTTQTWI